MFTCQPRCHHHHHHHHHRRRRHRQELTSHSVLPPSGFRSTSAIRPGDKRRRNISEPGRAEWARDGYNRAALPLPTDCAIRLAWLSGDKSGPPSSRPKAADSVAVSGNTRLYDIHRARHSFETGRCLRAPRGAGARVVGDDGARTK